MAEKLDLAMRAACRTLEPNQSVDYSPMTDSITYTSSWNVPIGNREELDRILALRCEGDWLSVRRFDTVLVVSISKIVKV